jgi:cell division protein FtsA
MLNLPFLTNKTAPDALIGPDDNYLAVDIGTEVLKILLFKTDSLGVNVKKVARIKQQQEAMSKGKIENLNTVLENCRLAISEIEVGMNPEDHPKHVVLGIAGEYVQGVSIVVNYEREEKYDQDVTQKEEDQIISKIHDQITHEGKSDLAMRTGLSEEDIEILHITTTGMEIGGMKVDSLIGFRGKSIRLFFYASFAPKTYIESLRKVSSSLNINLLGIVAQPFAVARAFAGSRNSNFSGIFIDIGGGTTDIAIVKDGNVLDSQMFAFGGRVFTKEIAKKMQLDYRHAESRKLKYSEGSLDRNIQADVRSILMPTAQLWMKTLKAALEHIEDVDTFPTQIYLCGGGALLPEIRTVMREFPWTRLLPFPSIPKTNIFLPERLNGITDETGDLRNAYDVTPASLARFAYDKIESPENYYLNIK